MLIRTNNASSLPHATRLLICPANSFTLTPWNSRDTASTPPPTPRLIYLSELLSKLSRYLGTAMGSDSISFSTHLPHVYQSRERNSFSSIRLDE
ncbi:hypothetical protein Agabi119p4_1779 [Agaricus bisporus var. burnettii]|uniref:Uncharacterized protein n=1 Tax=Agaricus bisporus var. burnettii TaxID=192524 RepID=A0A8H7KJN2_AGABI|nr:hypothetical protein Agabi119p4_1779 [Agaricus bisporus var. burnettii]